MSRRIVLACVLLAILAAASFLGYHFWSNPFVESFPPGASHDYLPADTATILVIDLKPLRDRGVLAKPLGQALQDILTKGEVGLPLNLLNVNPATDVDGVRLVFSPHDFQPLVLLQGRFDRTRFQTGPGQLQELTQDGFRLFYHQQPGRDLTLALADDTLVACAVRPRVLTALRHATGRTSPALDNPRMTALLEKVNRQAPLWLAADLNKLGKPAAHRLLAPFVDSIFAQAETARGEVIGNHGLTLDLVLECPAREKSAALKAKLQDAIKIFGAISVLLRNDPIVTLMKPFAAGTVEQDGTTVRVHANLVEE